MGKEAAEQAEKVLRKQLKQLTFIDEKKTSKKLNANGMDKLGSYGITNLNNDIAGNVLAIQEAVDKFEKDEAEKLAAEKDAAKAHREAEKAAREAKRAYDKAVAAKKKSSRRSTRQWRQ